MESHFNRVDLLVELGNFYICIISPKKIKEKKVPQPKHVRLRHFLLGVRRNGVNRSFSKTWRMKETCVSWSSLHA